jgi:anti-anti-sigma regulatory factor
MESTPQVLACRQGDNVLVRIQGRGEADLCPALRRFCEQALGEHSTEVHIDLGDCSHFDSTFLGTLLHLRKCRRDSGSAPAVTLVRPSQKCRELLQRMGAARLFVVVEESPDEGNADWVPLAEEHAGRGSLEFRRHVVQAHQELANVDGPLGDRYRMIAELAAQDLEAAQRR